LPERRRCASLLCLLGLASGLACPSCSHFETIEPVDVRAHEVAGCSVRIWTVDGEKLEFHAHKVTDEGVFGPARRIPFDRIQTLERRQFGLWETVGLVATLGAAAYGYVLWDYGANW
jgi:hypothetical protein